MQLLPIGISNFRTLITKTDTLGNHCLFVDKTLFIKDVLNNLAEVILITRPRRFGKTLNMSMLHHFFSQEVDNKLTKALFNNLKIAMQPECMQHQGQYPVISLTFKDIKSNTFTEARAKIYHVMRTEYLRHKQPILQSSNLEPEYKADYESFITTAPTDISYALQNLTFYLYQCYGVKPIVLIDEYDTPIQTAYLENYYKEMITFMRELLGPTLKDNAYLQKTVLTGILRVSKESLFSGLNNIKTYSLLDPTYGEYFGFTEPEVTVLLAATKLIHNITTIKAWYNGYQAGNAVLYNPWSIINCLAEQGELHPYWVNTSDNALIKELLINSSTDFKEQFEFLIQDQPIEKLINENFVFTALATNEAVIWSLLLMTGYLKVTSATRIEFGQLCQLAIPNKEVKTMYKLMVAEWLSGSNDSAVFNNFLTNLLAGNMDLFTDSLRTIMLQTFSVHDVKGKVPEKFYHGFMLGLIAGVDQQQYQITSNKESGLGRYDIALIPKDPAKLGIIFELKSLTRVNAAAAELALQQIDSKQYIATMAQHNIQRCLKVGIAFGDKELAVAHSIVNLCLK